MYYSNKFSTALAAGKVLDLAMTEGSGTTIADTSPTGATATIGAASNWSSSAIPFMQRSLTRPMASLDMASATQFADSGSNVGITGTSAFSMGGWFLFPVLTGNYEMAQNFGASSANNSWYLGSDNTGYITCGLYGNNGVSSVAVPLRSWIHLVATYSGGAGGTLKIYLNGALIYSSTTGSAGAWAPNITNGLFRMGRSASGTAYNFIGKQSDVFLTDYAITDAQVLSAFFRGSSPTSAKLVYKTTEGSGTSLADSSGNSNTGTITNATWSTNAPSYLRSSS